MHTVRFVQAIRRIIDPLVLHQTICNLIAQLVIQLARRSTMERIATTHVENALPNVKFALVVLLMIAQHVRLVTTCNHLDVVQLAH
jgi:hypothetical protein